MLGWLLIILAVLTGAFFLLTGSDASFGDATSFDRWGMIGGLVVMALLAIVLLTDYAGRFGQALRHLGIWIAITLALVTGYAFRDEIYFVTDRVAGELLPAGTGVTTRDRETGEVAVRIRQGLNGQFIARTRVNGTGVTMLVDTGASTVVLMPSVAARVGIDTSTLQYTVPVGTANGTTFAAPVRLRSVAIGPIVLDDVEALVAKPRALNTNLLGMSFLRRLRSYEFSGSFLTLRS